MAHWGLCYRAATPGAEASPGTGNGSAFPGSPCKDFVVISRESSEAGTFRGLHCGKAEVKDKFIVKINLFDKQ